MKSPGHTPVLSYYEGDLALPYCDFHSRLDGSSCVPARVAHLPIRLKMRYLGRLGGSVS